MGRIRLCISNFCMDKFLAEFIGTFVFVYVIITTGHPLAIGASLALMIYLFGKTSGGHFNPAVSLAMFVKGTLNFADFLPYLVVQGLGAVAALKVADRIKLL